MTYRELEKILSQLPSTSILVIGDFFLDKYLIIDPARNEPSLETGLTAYQVVGKRLSPGAAGTVTNNLRALGVGNVIALGVIGEDGEGLELRQALAATGVITDELIITRERVTPTYTKPMIAGPSGEREINRLDIKNWSVTPAQLEDEIIRRLRALAHEVDAIIALDQVVEENCGVITHRVREVLAELGRSHPGRPIYADSRGFTAKFRDIMVKCNHHEVVRAIHPQHAGEETDDLIRESGLELAARTHRPVFITCGSQGQLVIEAGQIQHVLAIKVEGPLDIVGAGDATTAGTVCGLSCGASLTDAALLGNLVASLTIQQLGTTGTASPTQVLDRYRETFEN